MIRKIQQESKRRSLLEKICSDEKKILILYNKSHG